MTVYYNKSTKFICLHPTEAMIAAGEVLEAEAPDEYAGRILVRPAGERWAVMGGELKLIPDEAERATTAYKVSALSSEQSSLRRYLSGTDYVIAKLNELKLDEDSSYEEQKASYADVLAKRKEARKRIGEIDAEIAELQSAVQ